MANEAKEKCMSGDDLARSARMAGYYCLEGPVGVFHIAEIEERDRVRGVAFKIIEEGNRWLIALYSAREYECEKASDIASLALDLLSGTYIAQGQIPYDLPQPFLEKYRISQVN
jgi:hypothetical protein